MGRRASNEEGLREAPLLPGLGTPSEEGGLQAAGRSGAAPAGGAADPGAEAAGAELGAQADGVESHGVENHGVESRGADSGGTKTGGGGSAAGTDAGAKPRAPKAGATAPGRPPPDHLEHRRRLRARFLEGGPDAMPDYELLELVLFRAVPRRDMKPLAKRLLRAFGGFDQVLAAPPARLAEVQGVGDAVVQELKIVEAAAHRLARARVMHRDAIQSWDQLVAYCRARMAREPTEQFRILFLDRKNMLIADEAQGRGTVDHVPVYPREVVRRGLELSASALILVHNHPSGDPTPSRADVDMTRRIMAACEAVGLSVHDHVIIGRDEVASFHDLGLLDP